jgi:hypothetical protein
LAEFKQDGSKLPNRQELAGCGTLKISISWREMELRKDLVQELRIAHDLPVTGWLPASVLFVSGL